MTKAQKEAKAKEPKKNRKVTVILLCNYGKEKPNTTIEVDDLIATSLFNDGLAKKVWYVYSTKRL